MFLIAAVGMAVAAAVLAWPVVNDRVLQPVATNSEDTAAIQDELDSALERLTGLEADIATLEGNLAALNTTVDDNLSSLSDQISTADSRIDAVDTQLVRFGRSGDAADAELSDRLAEVKAMELMSRARLFLYQANYGLAAQDVSSARAILADITSDDPALTLAVERLGVVLLALPDRPVAASADLDIAWLALLGEIPEPAPTEPLATSTATTIPGATSIPGATVPGTATTQP